LEELADRIVSVNSRFYNLQKAVVVPFGHLSNKLEDPEIAKQLLDKLVSILNKFNLKTERISFGTHKRFLWETRGQVAEASYFEFPKLE